MANKKNGRMLPVAVPIMRIVAEEAPAGLSLILLVVALALIAMVCAWFAFLSYLKRRPGDIRKSFSEPFQKEVPAASMISLLPFWLGHTK